LIETAPLALGTCFDFTGDGICEVTRISNSTVILEGDFTPGWPTSEVVYDEGPAVEEEEEAVAEEDDNDDDNNYIMLLQNERGFQLHQYKIGYY
jgi:hypothetical protein